MIEFMNWYNPGGQLVRCLSCGALLCEGDTDQHTRFHERVDQCS